MKRRGLRVSDFGYNDWEQAGKVYVYATNGVGLSNIEKTIDIINDVINEFNLPLLVLNGNASKSEDMPLSENLIASNTSNNLIDCESSLTELQRYWNDGILRYGLIILVSPERYKFKNDPSATEPACYGWTDNQGLSVLRRFDIQNAVRHEFGHMIGLGHHQGCALDWNCSVHKFCANCVKDINEIWELNPNSACGAGGSIKPGA
jgi:hypothetical protein